MPLSIWAGTWNQARRNLQEDLVTRVFVCFTELGPVRQPSRRAA